MTKLLSGRVKKIPSANVSSTRYQFLKLEETEPDLGLPSTDGQALLSNVTGYRYWGNVFATISDADKANIANTVLGQVQAATTSGFANLAGYANVSQNANVANIVLSLSNFTTSNLSEGTNLYFTNARVAANVSLLSINVLYDVDTTGASTNQVLTWNGTRWVANNISSIGTASSATNANTASIANTALTANVSNTVLSISNFTTSNLTEGTNLYFSNARAITAAIPAVTQLKPNIGGGAPSSVFYWLFDDNQYLGTNPTVYVTAGETISFDLNNISIDTFGLVKASTGSNVTTGLTHVSPAGTITTGAGAQGKTSGKLFWKVPFEEQGNVYNYTSFSRSFTGNIVVQKPTALLSTFHIPENGNLYYTDTRVLTNVSSMSINVLADVNTTGASSGQILGWNGSEWIPTSVAGVTSSTFANYANTANIARTANLANFANVANFANTSNIANSVLSLSNFTTSNLTEGTNLYFTNARVTANVSLLSINVLYDVDTTGLATNKVLTWNGTAWVPTDVLGTGVAAFANTSLLAGFANSAGQANQANTALTAATATIAFLASLATSAVSATTASVADIANVANFANVAKVSNTTNFANVANIANLVVSLENFTTSNLLEGNNLYYTNARVLSNVSVMSINVLADVNTSGLTDGQVLVWQGSSNNWIPGTISLVNASNISALANYANVSGGANVANVVLTISNFTTSNLAEGNNLYYTNARVYSNVINVLTTYNGNISAGNINLSGRYYGNGSALLGITTAQVKESGNLLYFTNALSRLSVSSANGIDYQPNTGVFQLANTVTFTEVRTVVTTFESGTANSLTILGNLTVYGNVVGFFSNTLIVNDPLIQLGYSNPSDAIDLGFIGHYNQSGTERHAGLFRDASETDKRFKFFEGYTLEPNTAVIATTDPSFALANVEAKEFIGNINWNRILNVPDPRITVNITGDVSGSAYGDIIDLQNNTINIVTAINPNSVALGTDTTGDYVANLIAGTGVFISGLTGESATPTIAIGQNIAPTANVTFNKITADGSNITNLSTDQIREGSTNLYYTNTRVFSNVSLMSIDVLADVSTVGVQTGNTLYFDGSYWVPGPNFVETPTVASTANLVLSLDNFTTSNLIEGSNLYFTNARARAAFTAGSGIFITPSGVISANASSLYVDQIKYTFTSVGNQSVFNGNDDNGQNLVIASPNKVLVFLNGVLLMKDIDYTANSIAVVLNDSVTANDVVTVFDGVLVGAQNTIVDYLQNVNANLLPFIDNYYSIGSSTLSWKDLYLANGIITFKNAGILNAKANAIIYYDTTGNIIFEANANSRTITPLLGVQGTYGNATIIPAFSVDQFGRIISISNVNVAGISAGSATSAESANVANIVLSISNFTTANLTEGSNQYFTNARVAANVALLSINVLADVDTTGVSTGNALIWNGTNWVPGTASGAGSASTAIFAQTANVANSASTATFAQIANVSNTVLSISNFTTANLTEGTNLYFTNARVTANVSLLSINVLYDVDTTNVRTGNVLTWNGTQWIAANVVSSGGGTVDLATYGGNILASNVVVTGNLTVSNINFIGGSTLGFSSDNNTIIRSGVFVSRFEDSGNVFLPNLIVSGKYFGDGSSLTGVLTLASLSNSYISNISIGNVAAGNITAGNIIVTGRFIGDGSGLTGITASAISITTSSVAEGTNLYYTNARVISAIQNNYLGNITAGNAYIANLVVGNLVSTGNITSISFRSDNNTIIRAGIFDSTFTDTGNVLVPNLYVYGNIYGDGQYLTGVLTRASLANTFVSNISVGSLSVTGNINAGNIILTGKITGDGSGISNISAAGIILSTSNVFEGSNLYFTNTRVITAVQNSYFANLSVGNLSVGNINTNNGQLVISVSQDNNTIIRSGIFATTFTDTGNVTVPNLIITGGIFGNASTLTGVVTTSSLNSYSFGNISAGNVIVTGKFIGDGSGLTGITASAISITTSAVAEGSNLYYTNARVISAIQNNYLGNISAGNAYIGNLIVGNITSTGNVTAFSFRNDNNTIIRAGIFDSTFTDTGNVILPNLYVSGVVSGNGAGLINVPTTITSTTLVSYGGSILSSNIVVTGNVSANSFIATGNVNAAQIGVTGNLIANNATIINDILLPADRANSIVFLNAGKYVTTSSALTFDGNVMSITGNLNVSGNINFAGNTSLLFVNDNNTVIRAGIFTTTFTDTGNILAPNIYASGIISGDGSGLTNLRPNLLLTIPTYTGSIAATNVTVAGNVTAQNVVVSANTITGNLTVINDISLPSDISNAILYLNSSKYISSSNSFTYDGYTVNLTGNLNVGNVNTTGGVSAISFSNDNNTIIRAGIYQSVFSDTGNVTMPNLVVTGTVTATDLNTTSDMTLKNNVDTIRNPFNILNYVRGVQFNWKESGEKSYGVIAQELQRFLPELVKDSSMGKTVSYLPLIAFLVEAVKDLQNQINDLKRK